MGRRLATGCWAFALARPAPPCGDRSAGRGRVTTGQAIPVRTSTVATRDLTETLTLTGTLGPRARVVVVAEVAARLMRLLKDEGDLVKQGDVIAVLDDSDLRLARDRATAVLDLAEANRAHARVEEDRAASLLKTGGITDKDRVAAQVAVQLAEASHAQARIELAIAEQQLSRTEVRAPLSGRIAKRSGDSGAMLAVGSPIFDIVDDAVFRISRVRGVVGPRQGARGRRCHRNGGCLCRVQRQGPGHAYRARRGSSKPFVRGGRPHSRAAGTVSGLFARADIHARNVPGSLTCPHRRFFATGDPSKAGHSSSSTARSTDATSRWVSNSLMRCR